MIKKVNSPYQAGARNFTWVKMKKSEEQILGDTVDCVVLGYYFGRGARAKFGIGGFLAAVWDENEERYKKNIIILGQITFFAFMTYIFVTPIYIYTWMQNYDNIMIVFLFHTMTVTFWTSIILEILNNYRYILTGIYWSFVGLFISIVITIIIFSSFTSSFAKLISLILLLPIINFSITFFKQTFECLYFYYNKYTNQDQLWDIFYQIEMEEKEKLKEEEEKNSL